MSFTDGRIAQAPTLPRVSLAATAAAEQAASASAASASTVRPYRAPSLTQYQRGGQCERADSLRAEIAAWERTTPTNRKQRRTRDARIRILWKALESMI